MITYQRKAGTTDVSVVIRIIDSADGTPETGVTSATSGIDLEYRREGAAVVNITEADLSALTDAHSDGGMLHIGGGYYRLDLPDAAVAAGATGVLVAGTITNMVVIGCYIQLVAYDPFDTVRLGLTALPNAAADAAGGLPISDAGGLDLDAQRSDVAAILVDTGTTLDGRIPAALVGGRMDSNIGAISADATAADNLEAMLDGTGGSILSLGGLDLYSNSNTRPVLNIETGAAVTGYTPVNIVTGADTHALTVVTSTDRNPIRLVVGGAATSAGLYTNTYIQANIQGNLTGDVLGEVGSVGTDGITAASIATNAIDADALAADAVTEIQSGLATSAAVADLPTNAELAAALGTADDATLAAIAALNNLSAAQVNAEVVDALTVDVIADSVAADGSRPTIAQALLMINRFLMEKSVSSTTVTVKKEDGTTSSMTFTLDDASAPTSITRAS